MNRSRLSVSGKSRNQSTNSAHPASTKPCTFSATCVRGTDEVVAHVHLGVTSTPELPAAGRIEPGPEIALGVEQPAVGTVGAHDRVEVAPDPFAVLPEHRRLVDELVETDLPVGGVGLARRDRERDLLAAARRPRSAGASWIGFGSQYAPSNLRCCPSNVTVSSVQSRFTTVSVSSSTAQPLPRARGTDSRRPGTRARTTRRRDPRMRRPPENTSMHAVSLARSPALR